MSIEESLGQKKKKRGQLKETTSTSSFTHAVEFPSLFVRPIFPGCSQQKNKENKQTNKQERTCACSRAAAGETAEPGRLRLPAWEEARERRGRASEGFDGDVVAEERGGTDDEQHLLLAATGRASVPAAAGVIAAVKGTPVRASEALRATRG